MSLVITNPVYSSTSSVRAEGTPAVTTTSSTTPGSERPHSPARAGSLEGSVSLTSTGPYNVSRLQALAVEFHLGPDRTQHEPPTSPVPNPSKQDVDEAKAAVTSLRKTEFESRRHVLRRSPSKSKFSSSELDEALAREIEVQHVSTDKIQALVNMGARIYRSASRRSLSLRKKGERRSECLERAVRLERSDLVAILVKVADAESITSAFAVAVTNQDASSMEVLLQNGADPNERATDFISFVESDRNDLGLPMVHGTVELTSAYMDQALKIAVSRKNNPLVRRLLSKGADPRSSDGQSYLYAARTSQNDVLLRLCLAKQPMPHTLDQIATMVRLGSQKDPSHLQLLKILIAAGLPEQSTDEALVRMTTDPTRVTTGPLMLVRHGASIAYGQCEASKSAIAHGDENLLRTLLIARDSPQALLTLMRYAQDPSVTLDDAKRLSILSLLLSKRPTRFEAEQCLLYAAEAGQLQICKLLIDYGASCNHERGLSLRTAVQKGDVAIVKALMSASPSPETLRSCISVVHTTSYERSKKLLIARLCLIEGVQGKETNEVLESSCTGRDLDLEYIEMLVPFADVNFQNAICLKKAVKYGNTALLRLLVSGNPTAASLASATNTAMTIRDAGTRQMALEILTTKNSNASGIQDAIVRAAGDRELLKDLQLFASRVDVNYHASAILEKAASVENIDAIKIIAPRCKSQDIRDKCFLDTLGWKDRKKRYGACEYLLELNPSPTTVDSALIIAVKQAEIDIRLVELFLKARANPNTTSGAAFCHVLGNVEVVTVLLTKSFFKPTTTVLETLVIQILEMAPAKVASQQLLLLVKHANEKLPAILTAHLHETLNSEDHELVMLKLFLDNGADADARPLMAIEMAVTKGNLIATNLLLQRAKDHSTFIDALAFCSKASETFWLPLCRLVFGLGRKLQDLDGCPNFNARKNKLLEKATASSNDHEDLIKLLVEQGANIGINGGQSLEEAFNKGNETVFKLLLDLTIEPIALKRLVKKAITSDVLWEAEYGPRWLSMIEKRGITARDLNNWLVQAVKRYSGYRQAPKLLTQLIQYGANVGSGDAVFEASKTGNRVLFSQLLKAAGSAAISARAVHCVLISPAWTSNDVLSILWEISTLAPTCLQNMTLTDWHSVCDSLGHVKCSPPLFQCLSPKFKESNRKTPEILAQLLALGAPADQEVTASYNDAVGQESTTLLLHLLIMEQRLSESWRRSQYSNMVHILLKHGVNVNFTSSKSRFTALQVALERKDYALVVQLIVEGADVNLMANGFPPLYFASKYCEVETVEALIEAGAWPDEESLHVAARHCKGMTVKLLLQRGHDMNAFNRDCKSPLGALIDAGPPENSSVYHVQNTMKALFEGGVSWDCAINHRPLIFVTMTSIKPELLTSALLAAGMGERVNESFNIMKIADGRRDMFYSPLGYATYGAEYLENRSRKAIIRILEANGCKMVYFASIGPQPRGWTGAPAEIQKKEKERVEREEARALEEKRIADRQAQERREAQHQLDLRDQQHRQRMAHEAEKQQQEATDRARRQADEARAVAAAIEAAEVQRAGELRHQQALARNQVDLLRQLNQEKQSLLELQDGMAEREQRRQLTWATQQDSMAEQDSRRQLARAQQQDSYAEKESRRQQAQAQQQDSYAEREQRRLLDRYSRQSQLLNQQSRIFEQQMQQRAMMASLSGSKGPAGYIEGVD